MTPQDLWELFTDTGAPEIYLMYRQAAQRAEPAASQRSTHVAQGIGTRSAFRTV